MLPRCCHTTLWMQGGVLVLLMSAAEKTQAKEDIRLVCIELEPWVVWQCRRGTVQGR